MEGITESRKATNINKDNFAVKEIKSMIQNKLNHLSKILIQIFHSIFVPINHARKVLKISF